MLMLFLYTTSPRARSLRPIGVPSDQILGGDSHSCFPLIKDKNFLSPYVFQIDKYPYLRVNDIADAAHVRQCYFSVIG
jgi:hypothetical protein